MAEKFKKTRPELLRQRRALTMYKRYLPTLTLKKQQLQMEILKVRVAAQEVRKRLAATRERMATYAGLLAESLPGRITRLVEVLQVHTEVVNIAGVKVPVLRKVDYRVRPYSRLVTPPWVDRGIVDLQDVLRLREERRVLDEQERLLQKELRKVTQRLNLFEKVKIPNGNEAIRVIRIALAEQQTEAVGRAKIAKAKVVQAEPAVGAGA